MALCGYCNHPGYHAQCIPLATEPSRRCRAAGRNWTGTNTRGGS